MKDLAREAAKSLDTLPYTVVYQSPEEKKTLPVVSYYLLEEMSSFSSDNTDSIIIGYIQADVWAKAAAEVGRISAEAAAVMSADGWHRDFARDMPPSDGVYHKTMRFCKEFVI